MYNKKLRLDFLMSDTPEIGCGKRKCHFCGGSISAGEIHFRHIYAKSPEKYQNICMTCSISVKKYLNF